MPFSLSNLSPKHGSTSPRTRRLGRGHGSGRGKTAGRGTKGQKARTGGRRGLKRLGMKRILLAQPKLRGFRGLTPKPATVDVGVLEFAFAAGAQITPKVLVTKGIIRTARTGVKLLGGGTITKAFTIKNIAISNSAKEKITAAGGSVS